MTPELEIAEGYLRYNLHGLLNLAAGFFNLTVGLIVFSKNPRSRLNQSFLFVTITSTIWVVGFGMMSLVRNPDDARLWLSLSYVCGVPFISPAVFVFSSYWFKKSLNQNWVILGLIGAFVVMVPITFFSAGIYDLAEFSWGRYSMLRDLWGAYIYYASLLIFFYFFGFASFLNFYRGWKNAHSPVERKQFRNVYIGVLIAYTGSIDFMYSLNLAFYPFGYLSLSIFISIVAYTIVRHRFLEINLFIKRLSLIFLIYSFLLALMIPLAFPIFKEVIRKGGAEFLPTLILLSLILGGIFSLGPFIYAYLLRRDFWLKGNLSRGLAHELKSPLGGIQGALELIQDRLKAKKINTEKVAEYAGIIDRNAVRLENFVKDLLSVAQISDGRYDLNLKETDLSALVHETLEPFQPMIHQKNLKLKLDFPSPLKAYVDTDKIKMVFSNLISNAVKFSSDGQIKIHLDDKNGVITGWVSDEGLGVSPNEGEKIFERFYKGNENLKGSGIGLTIAKGWVEAHGGKIWAEKNTNNSGTTFHFSFKRGY